MGSKQKSNGSNGLSRRTFLKGAAAGLGAAGAMAAVPAWLTITGSAPEKPSPSARQPQPQLDSPLVAYIRDAGKGEVVLMVGTREVVRKDPGLVSHLVSCCEV